MDGSTTGKSPDFLLRPLPLEVVRALFDGAPHAPSSGAPQPWLFVYAGDAPTRRRALTLLEPDARNWAGQASLFVFAFARRRRGDPSTEALAQALTLQAQSLGLICRATSQLHGEQAHSVLCVPSSSHELVIAFAIGYPALQSEPVPSVRRENRRNHQHLFVFNGRYLAEQWDVQG